MILATSVIAAPQAARASDVANPLFGYSHLVSSPFTMPAGRLAFGTEVAFGLTHFMQVSTNLLRDFYQVYNANIKVSLVDHEEFALALTTGWEHYDYANVFPGADSLKVTSWQPGVVTAYELLKGVALFAGANLNFSRTDIPDDGVETSGYFRGATVNADLSWAYNPPTRKREVGNVFSTGVSYDLTYKLLGVGFSHHWKGFHLGIHYYPNADQYRVQPIIAGGGVVDL